MESINLNREDQPTNSVKHADDDQPELQDGRSYECMYCKHGFTNAQALGGHMNVHRKDRAKNMSYSSNKKTSTNRLYEPCLISNCILAHDHQEGQTREFMLRSSPTFYDNNFIKYQNLHGLTTSPARDEIRLRLSLEFHQPHEEQRTRGGNEEDEIDLELRLGHDP